MINKIIIVNLLIIFYCSVILPQNNRGYSFINTADGLSQNEVHCIHEDKKGFIWFGTQDGLNRYDGYSFKIYRPQPGEENSLADYAINSIAEDDSGNLWIATRSGINKFNPSTDEFRLFQKGENENGLRDNIVWKILADGDLIWAGTKNGLNSFNKITGDFFYHPVGSNDVVIRDLLKSGDDLWIASSSGLYILNLETNNIRGYFNGSAETSGISNSGIYTVAEDKNKNIWVGTGQGLGQVLPDGTARFIFFYPGQENSRQLNTILQILIDNEGVMWLATAGGLIQYNPSDESYQLYSNINTRVRALHQDRSGIIWGGTAGEGIIKILTDPYKFRTVPGDDPYYSFYYDNKKILTGEPGGIKITDLNSIIDGKEHSGKKYRLKDQENLNITSIIRDDAGNYWTGTFGGGITVLDRNYNHLKTYRYAEGETASLSSNFIHKIYKDSKGNIWIGTGQGGLAKYIPEGDSFMIYKPDPDNKNSLSSNEVTSITEDLEGNLWSGTTTGGLNRLTTEGKITRYLHKADDRNSITSNRINTLYFDTKGNLWIGTFGGGLLKLEGEDKFHHYGIEEGLNGNTIFSIEEDHKGNLWMSTERGISVYNSSVSRFKNYNETDGLLKRFIPGSSLITAEGYLIFGGMEGFNHFHPDSLRENSYKPPVVITDFRIFNRSVDVRKSGDGDYVTEKNISYLQDIEIPYNNNVFSFEFSSLHFASPERNSYAYKMEGFDQDWIYSGTRRFVTYTNLDPGSYIFKVRGTNSDGIWNAQETELMIRIIPPWWRTWWAYLLFSVVFLFLLYALRKYEMHRIKLKNDLESREYEAKKLYEVDQMKSRFFANISHEFRTPLTLILGILEKRNGNTEDQVMRKNARRLLQLINQLLELSKIESGNTRLKIQRTGLLSFLKRVSASFMSYAEQKNITIKLNSRDITAEQMEKEIFVYIDQEKMETVFYNLLSNAVKFTPVGERIYIDTIPDKWNIEVNVTNTGTGISQENIEKIFDRFYQTDDSGTREFEGTGIGLALVKELTELHKGEVSARSIGSKETTFIIKLPLGRAHFNPEEVLETEEQLYTPMDKMENEVLPAAGEGNNKLVSHHKEIILIVEDHNDLRSFIKSQLDDKYEILQAEDGAAGLRLAEEVIPDLIISDIMMPQMDGNTLCRKIKENTKTNHIPVILLTAKASSENKIEGLETGADDYIIKPFNTDELRIRVKNLIESRRKMREKFRSEMCGKPAEVIENPIQRNFIEKLTSLIEENIDNEKFSIEMICSEMGMSRTQLHRKIKALTSQSTTEFVRNVRLQKAADLIQRNAGNMAEISYMVGFNSQAYFTKSFQELYGVSPSEYKKKISEPA
jgi:signal transduction histidine kinase/ligand-binding sensor domain-containing protein/DNA-binding response OmpR family regulator